VKTWMLVSTVILPLVLMVALAPLVGGEDSPTPGATASPTTPAATLPAATATPTAASPTPVPLSAAPEIDAARAAIVARSGSLATFVRAVEAQDVEAVLAALPWHVTTCDRLMYRGVTECERAGMAPGTVLELFAPEWWEFGGLERADAREAMTFYLEGRNPRLAMVADRSDGSIVVLFHIDPRPHLNFPGAVPESGGPAVAIWFATVPGGPSLIATYNLHFEGSPPLEFLRYDAYHGIRDSTILGASDEFRAMEQAWREEDEKRRGQP
jgi:hypothetical protein